MILHILRFFVRYASTRRSKQSLEVARGGLITERLVEPVLLRPSSIVLGEVTPPRRHIQIDARQGLDQFWIRVRREGIHLLSSSSGASMLQRHIGRCGYVAIDRDPHERNDGMKSVDPPNYRRPFHRERACTG